MRKIRKKYRKYVLPAVMGTVFVLAAIALSYAEKKSAVIPAGPFHAHADFKVFIDGKEMNFSSPEYNVRNVHTHLHTDNDFGGNVIHAEGRKAALGEFFASLGMSFNSTCFETWQEKFCNTEGKMLRFYVNGETNNAYGDYYPEDLDRILVSYGDADEDVSEQLDSVTNIACVFSNKCPVPSDIKVVTF